MRKNNNGFTIIEIVVVVIVVSILASMAFFGYNQVQKDARNSARSSKMQILNEALEKYYTKNGEYPSCSAMTQSGSLVSTNVLPGLEADILVAPNSPSGTTNSFSCTALIAGTGTDTFAYVGDGSATCSTGGACLFYTLQYRNEASGAIVSVDSKHKTQIAATTGSTLTATTISDTQINLSWTAVNNAINYQLQRATDANFTANLVTSSPSGTSASATSLAAGTTYYFKVIPVSSAGQGTASNTASATTTISNPAAPPTAAVISGANVNITLTPVTCASSTVEYQIQYRKSVNASFPAYTIVSTWSATTAQSVAASQGYKYEVQGQARCKGPNATSSGVTSATASVTVAFTTPAAPTYLSPASFDSPNSAIVNYQSYCPSGTTLVNATFRSRSWTGTNFGPNPFGFNDSWNNATGSNKNVEYWGKYQCQTVQAGTSAFSPESYNVIVVTP